MLPRVEVVLGAEIVRFYHIILAGVVYAAHNRGVVAWCQVCDNRRFICLRSEHDRWFCMSLT